MNPAFFKALSAAILLHGIALTLVSTSSSPAAFPSSATAEAAIEERQIKVEFFTLATAVAATNMDSAATLQQLKTSTRASGEKQRSTGATKETPKSSAQNATASPATLPPLHPNMLAMRHDSSRPTLEAWCFSSEKHQAVSNESVRPDACEARRPTRLALNLSNTGLPGAVDLRGSIVVRIEDGIGLAKQDKVLDFMTPRSRRDSHWKPNGGGTLIAPYEPFHASISRDGGIHFSDRPNFAFEGIKISQTSGIPVLAGHFDLTDAAMSAFGETLYPYRKLKLMDESRQMRANMAKSDKESNLREAARNHGRFLRWIWSQSSTPSWKRKLALFQLWDECAESGSRDLLRAASSVRATTLAFIHDRLPQGSNAAYTQKELATLNALRKSSGTFAPY